MDPLLGFGLVQCHTDTVILMPMDKFLKFIFPPLDKMRIVLFCPFEVVVRKKSDHRWAVPNLVLDSQGLQDRPSLPAHLAMADIR